MADIAIMIGTPQGARLLAFSDERKAADVAEAILRRLDPLALPAPLWVQCSDHALTQRLTDYLVGVQAELVGM
ncbi:hypothetical protein [Methylobacterium nigriterrae]|uniref:hypothetical protein n=1 Tax=Methylobacterium nigriterrae TaxID=3127512 RepID=UPI003013B976